ncbi:uncharacterized [Tachysurus ichikawai]
MLKTLEKKTNVAFFPLKVQCDSWLCKEDHCLDVSVDICENGRQCDFKLTRELFPEEPNKSGSDVIERQKPKYLAYRIDTLLKELNPKFKQEMKLSLNFL